MNGNPKTVVSAKQARGLRPRLTPQQSILFAMTILAAGGLAVPIALANPVMDPDIHLAAYHQEGRPIRLTRTGQLASDDEGTAYDVVPVYGADRVGLNDGYQLVEAGDGGPTVVGRLWGKLMRSLGFAGPRSVDWDELGSPDRWTGEQVRQLGSTLGLDWGTARDFAIAKQAGEYREAGAHPVQIAALKGIAEQKHFLGIAEKIERATGEPLTPDTTAKVASELVQRGVIRPADAVVFEKMVNRDYERRVRDIRNRYGLSKATKTADFRCRCLAGIVRETRTEHWSRRF